MNHVTWWEIMVAATGGIVLLFFVLPGSGYFISGIIDAGKIIVRPAPPEKMPNQDYWNFPLKIINNSPITLRNTVAFITIQYDPNDLRDDPRSVPYDNLPSEQPFALCWPGDDEVNTKSFLDIGEGQTAILPVFRRYRMANQTHLLQVSAAAPATREQEAQPYGLFLNGAKEYDFLITLIADNAPLIIDQYRINIQKADNLELAADSQKTAK